MCGSWRKPDEEDGCHIRVSFRPFLRPFAAVFCLLPGLLPGARRMRKVRIILVDWNGYPLYRRKKIGKHAIKCGIARLLDCLLQVEAGVDFDLHVVINQSEEKHRWYDAFPRLRRYAKPSKEAYQSLMETYPFVDNVYFRGNDGFDIGAYNFGFKHLQSVGYDGDVLFMNSSVVGPRRDGWLRDYQRLFYRTKNTGLCGITLNSHNTMLACPVFAPHVQTFFMYTNVRVLTEVFDTELPGSNTSEKVKLISEGEIGISKGVLEAGYSIRCSAFPDFNYRMGDDWTIPMSDIRFSPEFQKYANQVQPI